MALVTLSFGNKLEVAYLEAVRPQTMNLLPMFGWLRSCHLEPADWQSEMDLSALQHLCSLKSLGLIRGWFTDVPIALSLTALRIDEAEVTAAEDSVCSALSCLQICGGILHGLHTDGLLGCKNLQSLLCGNCTISAANQENYFRVMDAQACFVLEGISQLTRLTCLHAVIGEAHAWARCPDFTWTFQVSSLRKLTYRLQSHDSACDVLPQLTLLTNLEQLDIHSNTPDTAWTEQKCWVRLLVDWSLMSKLQKLEIRNGTFEFDHQILGLSKLTSLKHVSIDNVICKDPPTVSCLEALVTRLSQHCPALQVRMGTSPMDMS